MDPLLQMRDENQYFNATLCIIFTSIGFLGVLSFIFFCMKSKKSDGFLAIIVIGLGISGVNFWLWIYNFYEYYIYVVIFAVRPFVFLMTFAGAGALIEIIRIEKEIEKNVMTNSIILMLSIIPKIILFAEMAYIPIYIAINVASSLQEPPNPYSLVMDIYLTVVSQIVVIALVELYTFLSQPDNKIYIMISMIPSFIMSIIYLILGLIYRYYKVNPNPDKDSNYYYAYICYCLFIACGLIPAGFIPFLLKTPSDETNDKNPHTQITDF